MDWLGQRILITGIDGFIGSHLAKRFQVLGANVYGISRRTPVKGESGILLWNLQDKITNHIGDVTDTVFVKNVITESKPNWVFHLAAQSIVNEAQNNPQKTFHTNILGTLNMVSSCHYENAPQGIIVASSDKAYGHSDVLPYIESAPLRGGSVYDTSKACADMLSSCFSKWMRIPLAITRCANTYGPGDLNFSRIIPDVMYTIAGGRNPIIQGDGEHERDYIYIDDVISGYLKIVQYMNLNQINGDTFNIGTGLPTKVKDLVKTILHISDLDLDELTILNKEKPAEISRQFVDAGKARLELGWKPNYTLEDGLRITLKWYLNYLK
jgi:CDP-glucose 4,6-dehydratase